MVEKSLETYGFEPDPIVGEIFTKYRKTHNDGVFDVYPPDVRAARSAHLITGLPDAYGRGRIIGDYRRVALYGVDALIAAKRDDRADLDRERSSEDVIRDREENAEQIRALQRAQGDGRVLRLRHLRPGRRPPARPSSGCTSPTSARSRSRTARRCRWAAPRPSSTSTCSATWSPAGSPSRTRRSSSTTWSSSCASCGSCARPSTTSCSPATRPGSPSRSAGWARTAGRWSPRPRSGTCRRSTTWDRPPSRT